MSKAIGDYKIGDEMYRHVTGGGNFCYVVTGVRTTEDSVQLEVECQTCSHGWKCRLLLAQNDYGKIVHVHMLNEDEDDSQKHWHSNEGLHFWPTANEAREEVLRAMVRRADESIRKLEDALASERKRRAELAAAVGVAP